MKKKISMLMAAGVLSVMMSTAVMAGGHHGGGHHGSRASGGSAAYDVPAVSVCAWEDCLTIGEHYHDSSIFTHYYGDGHDFHDEYDHYEQAFHSGGYHC